MARKIKPHTGNVVRRSRPLAHAAALACVVIGPGLDAAFNTVAAQIPRIFERHHRAGSGPAGLGLGLHIVQRICARSGWRVSVSSVPSAGSVFVVSFS